MLYHVFGVLPWAILVHILVGPSAPAEETSHLQQYDPRCFVMNGFVCSLNYMEEFKYSGGKCEPGEPLGAVSLKDPRWPDYFKFLNCSKHLGLEAKQIPHLYNALEQILEKSVDVDQCEDLRITCRHWSCPRSIPTGECLDDRDRCFMFLTDMPERDFSTVCWDHIVEQDKTEMLLDYEHPIYEYAGWCVAQEMEIRRNIEYKAEEIETAKRGSSARESFCGWMQRLVIYFPNKKAASDHTLKIDATVYATIGAICIAIFGVNLFNFWGASRIRHLDRLAGEHKRQQMRIHYTHKIDAFVEKKKLERGAVTKNAVAEDFDKFPGVDPEPRSATTGPRKSAKTKTGKRKSTVKGKKSGKRTKSTTAKGKKSRTTKSKGTTGKKVKKIRKLKKYYKASKTSAAAPATAQSKSKPTTSAPAPATTVSKSKAPSVTASTAKPITAKTAKSGSKATTGGKTKGSKATGKKTRTVTFCSRTAGKVKVPKRRKNNKNKKRFRKVPVPVAAPQMHPNAAEIQKKIVGTYRPPIYDYEIVAEQRTQESERRSQEAIEKTQMSTKSQGRPAKTVPKKGKGKKAKKVSKKSDGVLSEKSCIGSETAHDKSQSAKSKSKKAKGKAAKAKDPKRTLSEKTAEDSVAAAARKKSVNEKTKEKVDKKSKDAPKEVKKDVLSERTALGSEVEVKSKAGKRTKGKKEAKDQKKAASKRSGEPLSEKTARGSEVETKSKGHKGGKKTQGRKAVSKDQKRAQRSAELLSEKTAVGSEADTGKKDAPKVKKDVPVDKKATEGNRVAVQKPGENKGTKAKAAAEEKKKGTPKAKVPITKKTVESTNVAVLKPAENKGKKPEDTQKGPKGKAPKMSQEKVADKKSTKEGTEKADKKSAKGKKPEDTQKGPKGKAPKMSQEKVADKKSTKEATEKADKKSAKESKSKANKDSRIGKGQKEKSSRSTTGKPSSGAKYADDLPTKAVKAAVKDNKEAARTKAAQKRMDMTNTI